MQTVSRGGYFARLRDWFPDREFIMRSQGQVRFVKISGKLQLAAASIVAAIVLAWLVVMALALAGRIGAGYESPELARREAQVAGAERRVAAYRAGIGRQAEDLVRRQQYIEQMVETHLGDLPAAGEAPADGAQAPTPTKISLTTTGPLTFDQIEARQLAFVERMTRLADARSSAAERQIRRVGLNPRMVLARVRSAQGGPLERLFAKDETVDPRFAAFGKSMARMSALEQGLGTIPNHLPASLEFISSGFGTRSDPITGEPAMHAGLDFRGPIGAPIHAAANGRISFAGQRSGYGNCIEIDHGNGLMTRYAHMSAFRAHIGQEVAAGDVIGAIGSTGRSTGPHLHFEVRINGSAVNPRPFLESQTHVQQEIGGRRAAHTS
ncbi:M23 family metallopeptidase [Novosphingobium tardum]|uniref:M23 family metallopeptidase n=1 Tax=Novosphingobium tardum TaxID=1538021 RepID=A0ABV8RLZ3_9SPHN